MSSATPAGVDFYERTWLDFFKPKGFREIGAAVPALRHGEEQNTP